MSTYRTPEDFAGTERFEIRRRLGQGGMGVVYEALDRERDALVALKTILHFDATALYHFKKEFRALEDLLHPNLVRLWELFSEGDRWFYTMELVDGCDFLRYVRPPRRSVLRGPKAPTLASTERDDFGPTTAPYPVHVIDEPEGGETTEIDQAGATTLLLPPAEVDEGAFGVSGLDVPRLRRALRQLAGALAALHASGRLHRDVKPSNVMVERGGRVVVLDFGVTLELRRQEDPESTDRHVLGTVAYMAPEQASGRPLTPASDWYSVGVMLYRALTGRLPFEGTRLEILTRKQTAEPPDPSVLVEGLPPDLAALSVDLLRREPTDRPPGDEILRRLGADAPEPAEPAARGRPWVGRESLLAALGGALEATRRGKTVAAFVQGRSGAGKSSLVQRFLDGLAGDPGVVVLEGRCFEQESVAFKALDTLIDALSRYLRRLNRLEAEALLPRDIAALARVFPVLRRVEAVAGAPQRALKVPDQQELRRRAFAALRELLARIGDRKTLILYIDDLQWGDLDSADLLADLLRPPDAPNLLLLCCYRSEYASNNPCLSRLLAACDDGANGPERREIVVDALTIAEARDLARRLLSRSDELPMALAEMVARESGGSPYYVYELAHYLTAGGEITDSFEAAGSVSLDEVIWRRIRNLPETPRRLLEVIAVAGQPVSQSSACRAAGLGAAGFEALGLLRVHHLVSGRGPGAHDPVETYHDRVRETVTRRLSESDRNAWHRVLGRELEEAGGTDPETLAVHFEEAEEPNKAAHYYAKAAAAAVESLAFERAAKLYRRVLELRPVADAVTRNLRVRLAEALANAGRGAEAATTYQQAADGAEKAEALDLQARAGYQYLISGRIDEGLAAFREVLDRVGLRRTETPREALLRLLGERLFLGVRGLGFRSRAATEVPPAEIARVDIARSVAVGISVVDVIQGSYFQSRSLRLALRAGEPHRVALSLGWEAVHSACQGRGYRRRTARLIALAETIARRVGQPHAIGMATLSAGAADYMAGRFPSATDLCDRAAQLFRDECTGVIWELDTAQVFGLWARIYQGEFAELSARFQALHQQARDRGDRYMESNLGTYPGVLVRLAEDDPDEARELARGAIAQWSQHGFHVQHLTYFYGTSYIDLYEGNGTAAWLRAEQTWPDIRTSLLPRIQHVKIDVLQCRGRTAVAAAAVSASPAPLIQAAEDFARQIDRERIAWGQPLAQLIRAGAASVRGDSDRAVRLLTDVVARADAERLGLVAAAARRRLGGLLGGDEGRDLIARADAWMTEQSIKSPARMTACLAPGFAAP